MLLSGYKENVGLNLHDLLLVKAFLDMKSKAQTTKIGPIHIKNVYAWEGYSQQKQQDIRKYFQIIYLIRNLSRLCQIS
jgi:hypothetical protein